MSKIMYTEEDFILHLKELIIEAGGDEKFCYKYKFDRAYLEIVLDGSVTPPMNFMYKLGYRKQLMYVKVEDK